MASTFGEQQESLVCAAGSTSALVDERVVRASAGVTLAVGAFALAYAFLGHQYLPIRLVTGFFFVDFLVRRTAGLRFSPVGLFAGQLARRGEPEWVPLRPKRFAWTLGLVLAAAMTVITNVGIRGAVPLTICLACLALMWMEAVLGFCLGCEVHRLLVGAGLLPPEAACAPCVGERPR
jgi:hypothetical protein